MFTGIISQSVTIRSISDSAQHGLRVICDRPTPAGPQGDIPWTVGDSIALNGICSTITALSVDTCTVEYMPETCRRTTVRQWQVDQSVHMEAPITVHTKFSGSVVLGHVDTVGTVIHLTPVAEHDIESDCALTIEFPSEYQLYVVPQGGITINGVNMTIVTVTATSCMVKLVSYTKTHTHLAELPVGQPVNIEFDYFAKLVAQSVRIQQSHLL